ncbi:MAG TPA: patatin-like phospholipase family protein [Planctomycetota bacterium]|nr:patatin-like phospholipase family protein [Planctomycetota bacterium]
MNDPTPNPGGPRNHASGNGTPSAARNGHPLLPISSSRRTVLVLGGGGMRGYCHIGVIRAIERLGLQIDEVVGTSMGAVMGALYATRLDSRRIEEVAGEITIKDYFKLNVLKFLVKGYRHASVYKGKTFHQFLQRWLPQLHFADLPRPFFCNALSLTTGASRFFGLPGADQVPVADAVYASSCLPAIFEPIAIGGDHYIDGGMTETLALRLAQARKADLIIGVDLSHRDMQARVPYRASLPHILFQTYEVMGLALNEHNLHRYADDKTVVIKPKVSHVGLLDMPDVNEIVRLGEREALEVLTTHPLTRYLCDPKVVAEEDRNVSAPRDHVQLDVDMNACIHCGICAATCATHGYAAVPIGDVVRKLHNYECTRDLACERNCPTGAIRLRNL